MILKILGSCLVVLGTTLWGYRYSEGLEKHVQQLKELELLVLNLQSEVMYLYSPLPTAFENIAIKTKNEIGEIFQRIANILKLNKVDTVYEAFNEVIEENRDELYLCQEDYDILLSLSKNLGDLDRDSQSNIFELSNNTLKKHIKDAEEKSEKNKKLYKYLGFSFGAIIVIMMI